ncbi:hypothetical protein B425_3820 [Bacillus amyloliquefaciens]|nr:hypothetical protein B425_3820 [Bacillus amyloliquefaciens]
MNQSLHLFVSIVTMIRCSGQRECAPESFRMCRKPALFLCEKRYSHDCSF